MDAEQIQHVYPIDDEKQHLIECERIGTNQLPFCDCECKPTHKEIGNAIQGITGMIVVHNSFDGREGVEWANEILNKKECLCDGNCDRFKKGGRKCWLDQ